MEEIRTNRQYDAVILKCRTEFFNKNGIYGQSWNRYRVISLLEKICIKLERIQNLQHLRTQQIVDSIASEFPAIINYSILGKVKCDQWQHKLPIGTLLNLDELEKLYDEQINSIRELFIKKNHDYGESWRKRSVGFMVDEMLTKYDRANNIYRSETIAEEKKIDEMHEVFSDICNYAVFCTILIDEGISPMI